MAQLRHIAIHVEEPKAGRFAWVLSELGSQDLQELQRSGSPAPSYHQAMADGLLALQALVPDLDIGPRGVGGSPPRRQADRAQERKKRGTNSALAPGKSYFGFGPAR